MKKRWIGYAAWLLPVACLYFFENNTGTRVVLLCSTLLPFIPPLRAAFFSPDEPAKEDTTVSLTAGTFDRPEPEETGDIRPYIPGDPVRRIHWKLSAKKDELLIRETAAGTETAEETENRTSVPESSGQREITVPESGEQRKTGRRAAAVFAAGILLCVTLLLLIPEARRGAQELCNRLFAASEAVNRYTYARFAVPEGQDVLPAALLLGCVLALLAGMTAALRSRTAAFGIMAACTLFQVYFGLAFPTWINIPLYSLLAVWMLRRPVRRRDLTVCGVFILLVTLMVAVFLPGTDAATETASEEVRDRLAQLTEQITGTAAEAPAGETETRHLHTRSLENGEGEAETGQEFRLVTEEEEQISMPHWVNWLKAAALLMLSALLVALPFTPFLLLNKRKKKAAENRKAFESENTGAAVQAIFRQVILWFEAVNAGAGNLLFRNWAEMLPEDLPEGYAERFARCAADCEEALYSNHPMPEQKRRDAMELLKETEAALWKRSNRRQRFYLKYWMCLAE